MTRSPFKVKVAASQNENSRHTTGMGTDVGEPDLRLAARVRGVPFFFYLELKTKRGRLNPNQKNWNADFDENFACDTWERAVGFGYDESKQLIDNWLDKLLDYHSRN